MAAAVGAVSGSEATCPTCGALAGHPCSDTATGEVKDEKHWSRGEVEAEVLRRALAEAREEITKLRGALKMANRNDKTPDYVYPPHTGKAARNRDGELPASGRWLTPREIAQAALRAASPREDDGG